MPIYTVTCPVHGKQLIVKSKPEGCEEAPCPECGALSPRDFVDSCGEPSVFKPYETNAFSPFHATRIETREQEKRIAREKHLVPREEFGPMRRNL